MGHAFKWIICQYAHKEKVIAMEEDSLNKEETVEGEAMGSRTIIWGKHRLHAEKRELDYKIGKWIGTNS